MDDLQAELANLKSQRVEVTNKIKEARDYGDLSENSEYQEAKTKQAFIEGRAVELEYLIKNATLIEETASTGVVGVGSKIKIRDNSTVREYKIVGSQEADPLAGLISHESPIGKAFLGKKIGAVVEINVPKGVIKYEIIEIL